MIKYYLRLDVLPIVDWGGGKQASIPLKKMPSAQITVLALVKLHELICPSPLHKEM
jgi:hypothetical protein